MGLGWCEFGDLEFGEGMVWYWEHTQVSWLCF